LVSREGGEAMTMTSGSKWTIVGLVAVAAVAIIASVAAVVWAAIKLWTWINGPAPGL
jgi:hypothetical protein